MRRWISFMILAVMIFSLGLTNVKAYNEYAPNSFDIVSTSSKEYKAVYAFCRDGKAPGYSTAFFKERSDMTRYELAGVIKNILESGLVTNENDQKVLQQLKKNYSRELSALGWQEKRKTPSHPIFEIQRNGDMKQVAAE